MIFRFNECVIDTAAHELRRNGRTVPVEPQVFDLLILLVDNKQRLVTKDEIIERIWHGRAVSDAALNSRIKSARQAIGDSGAGQQLIRTIRGKGYRFVGTVTRESAEVAFLPLTPSVEERPAVAVLPFELTGDGAPHAAGMTDEITTALFRLRRIMVTTPDRARYRLRGKVRGDGTGRLRVTAILSDALKGRVLWADHWDGRCADVFDLEDRVAVRVAQAIEPALRDAENDGRNCAEPDHLGARTLTIRALPLVLSYRASTAATALELLEQAMELAPGDPLPLSLAAWCHGVRGCLHFTARPKEEKAAAHALAARAAKLNRRDALTETILAAGYTLAHDLDTAVVHADRALSLDGGLAWAWCRRGWIDVFRGEGGSAIERLQIAQSLAHADPMVSASTRFATSAAHFQAARHDKAIGWMRRGIAERPDAVGMSPFFLASAYALANRKQEARRTLIEWKRARPETTIAHIKSGWPFARPFLERVAEGLNSAGLPNPGWIASE